MEMIAMTEHPFIKESRFFSRLEDGRVQCEVCPHHCRLQEGQLGRCYVRECRAGKMVSTTYGCASGFCVDPIEKKPLNHFLPGTAVLSFGTVGCNLSCLFCQNWHISRTRDPGATGESAPPESIAKMAARTESRSVAFTYNEPVVFLEYAVDTARACHERGIKTVAVTNGYIAPGAREEFYAHMDAANVDLKGFTDRFYTKLCGGHLQPVLDTLMYIKRHTSVWLEVTTLLIPGENDSPQELDLLTRWVCKELGPDVPLHFTAFHPDWKMMDHAPTPASTLSHAREIGAANGLHYIYTGNVRDVRGSSTFCRQCGTLLIERDGFDITAWHLKNGGICAACGAVCPGVFAERPGAWGSQRQPITTP